MLSDQFETSPLCLSVIGVIHATSLKRGQKLWTDWTHLAELGDRRKLPVSAALEEEGGVVGHAHLGTEAGRIMTFRSFNL